MEEQCCATAGAYGIEKSVSCNQANRVLLLRNEEDIGRTDPHAYQNRCHGGNGYEKRENPFPGRTQASSQDYARNRCDNEVQKEAGIVERNVDSEDPYAGILY